MWMELLTYICLTTFCHFDVYTFGPKNEEGFERTGISQNILQDSQKVHLKLLSDTNVKIKI